MHPQREHRSGSEQLLHYRPWRGQLRSPISTIWPIARHSLGLLFRRKLFWVLFALALFIFFMFFFGQYMLFWAESQAGQSSVPFLGKKTTPATLIKVFRVKLKLNGTGVTYRTFFFYQGYMLMVVLALGGSLLVGNDLKHGSLPFYLSKSISPTHYLLGKALAIGLLVNLITTVPALILFLQYGFLCTEVYFPDNWHLFWGIIGYGMVLTLVMTALLIAASLRFRSTVPLILTWTTLFFFCRQLSKGLVLRLNLDERWRLIDLWNSLNLVGYHLLGLDPSQLRRQPSLLDATLVLGAVTVLCLVYLIRRIRAVEVVT